VKATPRLGYEPEADANARSPARPRQERNLPEELRAGGAAPVDQASEAGLALAFMPEVDKVDFVPDPNPVKDLR
jgi:hypothetical protein